MTNTIVKRQNDNGYDGSFGTVVNNLFQNSLRHFFDDNFWEAETPVTTGVPVNIRETEKHYELDAIAPGCRKEDFNIKVEGNLLTISMDQKNEKAEQDEKTGWVRNEYTQRAFLRTFTLNDTVDLENINAVYSDGILHLSLGKTEKARKLSKTITVK